MLCQIYIKERWINFLDCNNGARHKESRDIDLEDGSCIPGFGEKEYRVVNVYETTSMIDNQSKIG